MYKFDFSSTELDLLKSSVVLRINYIETEIKHLKKYHDNDYAFQTLIDDYEKMLLSYNLLFDKLCNI